MVEPLKSPVSLATNAGVCVNGPEETCLLGHSWNQRGNQQRLGLHVGIFDGNLKAIKTVGAVKKMSEDSHVRENFSGQVITPGNGSERPRYRSPLPSKWRIVTLLYMTMLHHLESRKGRSNQDSQQ